MSLFSIQYQWQSFRVFLPDLEAWCRSNASNYTGNSADSKLTLWFFEAPTDESKAAGDAQWQSLTEDGEAAKWTLYDNRNASVEAAKVAILTEDITTLIPAERKILMNLPLTDADKDALVANFG